MSGHRWRPQHCNPVAGLRSLFFNGDRIPVSGGEKQRCLTPGLPEIVLPKEVAVRAVGLMVMMLLEMAETLPTVVMGSNGVVMHMQRCGYHPQQVAGQQDDRGYVS